MLTHRPITPILPVTNLARAREFYEFRLGLREAKGGHRLRDALVMEGGDGTRLELQKREERSKAEHTVVTFEVQDIATEVRELENNGVAFEDYDGPELKTEGHIAELDGAKAAWFRDPDGNILCIHQAA